MVDTFGDIFEGEFNRSIGKKIEYLTFLFAEYDGKREPCFAWMKTSDSIWHRFFIDAWVPHWEDLNPDEAKVWIENFSENQTIEEFVEEEMEEYESEHLDGQVRYKWIRENLLMKFDLAEKKLLNAEGKYIELDGFWCTQLKIDIEDGNQVVWNEYADKKEEELFCNGIKL